MRVDNAGQTRAAWSHLVCLCWAHVLYTDYFQRNTILYSGKSTGNTYVELLWASGIDVFNKHRKFMCSGLFPPFDFRGDVGEVYQKKKILLRNIFFDKTLN